MQKQQRNEYEKKRKTKTKVDFPTFLVSRKQQQQKNGRRIQNENGVK